MSRLLQIYIKLGIYLAWSTTAMYFVEHVEQFGFFFTAQVWWKRKRNLFNNLDTRDIKLPILYPFFKHFHWLHFQFARFGIVDSDTRFIAAKCSPQLDSISSSPWNKLFIMGHGALNTNRVSAMTASTGRPLLPHPCRPLRKRRLTKAAIVDTFFTGCNPALLYRIQMSIIRCIV